VKFIYNKHMRGEKMRIEELEKLVRSIMDELIKKKKKRGIKNG